MVKFVTIRELPDVCEVCYGQGVTVSVICYGHRVTNGVRFVTVTE